MVRREKHNSLYTKNKPRPAFTWKQRNKNDTKHLKSDTEAIKLCFTKQTLDKIAQYTNN